MNKKYPEFAIKKMELSEIEERFDIVLNGQDKSIFQLGAVTSPSIYQENKLTYVTNEKYFQDFLDYGAGACIIPQSISHMVPSECSVLVSKSNPMDVFYYIYLAFIAESRWDKLPAAMGQGNQIARSATIYENVQLGNDCVIMDNVVILPNTHIGDRVIIQPNTVIGGDGFQVRAINGVKKVIPHVGGVWISDDVEIGSNTCIDKGLFGDFTYIGEQTKIDNLVHIAHSVKIGRECLVIAHTQIAGNSTIGDQVRIAPGSLINNRIEIGDHALVGIGSVVIKDIVENDTVSTRPAVSIKVKK